MSSAIPTPSIIEEIVAKIMAWQQAVVPVHWVMYIPSDKNMSRVQAHFTEHPTNTHTNVYVCSTVERWFLTLEKLALTGQRIRPVVVTSNNTVADNVRSDDRWATFALPLHVKANMIKCDSIQWLADNVPSQGVER